MEEASEQLGIEIKHIDVVMAHGFLEYLDLKTNRNDELSAFLKSTSIFGRNGIEFIISQTDIHDRVPYYEKGLNLYMRLRGRKELIEELEKQQFKIFYAEKEPMGIITMVYCGE